MSALHRAQVFCVPCTGHLHRSRATSCRTLFRCSGTPRARSKVCRISTVSGDDIKTARAQKLQLKAKLLRKQQEELAEQLQQLNEESQSLSATDKKLVQAELSSQEPVQTENEIPGAIRDLLATSGVLTSVPWSNEAPVTDDAGSYFQTPDSSQSYDWDHATDTLNDVSDVAHAISSPDASLGEDGDSAADESDVGSDDEEGFAEDDKIEFEPGHGVEDMLRMLEEGGALPDIEGLMEAENAQEFQTRVQKLVDRYEAQFLKKKERKISTEEIRQMEKDEAWEPTTCIPVLDQDILEVRPVPAVPEDIEQQYDALQHCLYVLRRAHLEGQPDEPVKALASTELVDMLDVSFEDPLIASVGIGPWLQYMEGLREAGAWTQVEHIWAEVSDDRPTPVYAVIVDQFINVPFPDWFYSYLVGKAEAWSSDAGILEIPALLAVHESAPDDPSTPLQLNYPNAESPLTPKPFPPKPTRTRQQGKQQPADRLAAAAMAADVPEHVTSRSDCGNNKRSKPQRVRLAGLRQIQGQVSEDEEAWSATQASRQSSSALGLAAEQEEMSRLWYRQGCPDEARLSSSDSEQAMSESQTGSRAQQQQPEEQRTQQLQSTTEDSSPAGDAKQSSAPLMNDDLGLQTWQELQASQNAAGASSTTSGPARSSTFSAPSADSGYLPSIDLLGQFGEPAQQSMEGAASVTDSASSDAEDTASASGPASQAAALDDAPPMQELCDQASSATVNLDGAQVLTPEGWKPMSNQSEPGTAWEHGRCMTIGMTLQYEMSASSRQIVAVKCGWATIDAFARTVQDVLDMYIKSAGLDNL
ncbi:hypothetical protein WJX77_008005 [Trebouxia sp. C0004]